MNVAFPSKSGECISKKRWDIVISLVLDLKIFLTSYELVHQFSRMVTVRSNSPEEIKEQSKKSIFFLLSHPYVVGFFTPSI